MKNRTLKIEFWRGTIISNTTFWDMIEDALN